MSFHLRLQERPGETVSQYSQGRNFPAVIAPRHGVVTLFGYGIRVQVERGHLALEDRIGPDRRRAQLPRAQKCGSVAPVLCPLHYSDQPLSRRRRVTASASAENKVRDRVIYWRW